MEFIFLSLEDFQIQTVRVRRSNLGQSGFDLQPIHQDFQNQIPCVGTNLFQIPVLALCALPIIIVLDRVFDVLASYIDTVTLTVTPEQVQNRGDARLSSTYV
jgi:hypothetical protein